MKSYSELKRRVIVVEDQLSEHIAVLLEGIDKVRDLITNENLAADDCVMAIDKVISDVTGLPIIIEEPSPMERKRLQKLFNHLEI